MRSQGKPVHKRCAHIGDRAGEHEGQQNSLNGKEEYDDRENHKRGRAA
jgi:hypothetical protein